MKQRVLSLALGLIFMGLAGAGYADQGSAAAQLERGKVLFQTKAVPACAICHTLKDAGATGTIGPDLDALKPDSKAVFQAVKNGLGAMPSFAGTLSEQDIKAVAAYVAHAAGKTE